MKRGGINHQQQPMFVHTGTKRADVCRTCSRPIIFVRLTTGKDMPADPRKLTIVDDQGRIVSGYESHFATCPQAAQHRTDADRRRAAQEAQHLRPPLTYPAGTDPWALVDSELEPAYRSERELLGRSGRPDVGVEDSELLLYQLVHNLGEPMPVELETPIDRRQLERLKTYRVFGVPALLVTREQAAPAMAWICRHPKLLATVSERIER